jgi:hypothetical protein
MSESDDNDHIQCNLYDELLGQDNSVHLQKLLEDFENTPYTKNTNSITEHALTYFEGTFEAEQFNYDLNYTTKQLVQIGEYYCLKMKKMKKNEIINAILLFENESENLDKVHQRIYIWNFLNELKKDPIMKKYIMW